MCQKAEKILRQCNQICGVNHAYMPIVIQALNEADYAEWLLNAKEEFASAEVPSATLLASAN